MTVLAVLRDGREVRLAASLGATTDEVIDTITSSVLTGSAVPDIHLPLEDGTYVDYIEVNTFTSEGDLER
jgi:hypothetical protein